MMRFAQKLLMALMLCITLGAWFTESGSAQTVDVVFLHHSTGGNLYNEGNVAGWFSDYNGDHGTNYIVTERAYPDSPYDWENYPYDYWNLWVNTGVCDSTDPIQPGIACMNIITQYYDVVIFKHCYPGADIQPDSGAPNVASADKELQNYKAQYRALRTMMDGYPNTKFIVWTLVPLHRLATDAATAARAKQFVDWVKGEWLTEGGGSHPNIFIFDFWGYAASQDASQGTINMLRYAYEINHEDSNSHPNTLANQTIGPYFSQFIVDVIENNAAQTSAYLLWTK